MVGPVHLSPNSIFVLKSAFQTTYPHPALRFFYQSFTHIHEQKKYDLRDHRILIGLPVFVCRHQQAFGFWQVQIPVGTIPFYHPNFPLRRLGHPFRRNSDLYLPGD